MAVSHSGTHGPGSILSGKTRPSQDSYSGFAGPLRKNA